MVAASPVPGEFIVYVVSDTVSAVQLSNNPIVKSRPANGVVRVIILMFNESKWETTRILSFQEVPRSPKRGGVSAHMPRPPRMSRGTKT